MKLPKLLFAVTFCTAAIFIITATRAPLGSSDSDRFGQYDSHHVWHDAEYWHSHHPDWVYRYHPEWAVEHEEWWRIDHERHPDWFRNPFWQAHPVWRYGDYDRSHIWRSYRWWHEHNPEWLYAHHPEWAETRPHWIRDDHSRHPEWFRSAYWHEHAHDWNHPDQAFRRDLSRNLVFQKTRQQTPGNARYNAHRAQIARQPWQTASKRLSRPTPNSPPSHANAPSMHSNPPSRPSAGRAAEKKN
jgi:hypothetical protein